MDGSVRNTRGEAANGRDAEVGKGFYYRTAAYCAPSHALKEEMRVQCTLIGPVAATVLLQVLVDMITLIMVGHLGATELAGEQLRSPHCVTLGPPPLPALHSGGPG